MTKMPQSRLIDKLRKIHPIELTIQRYDSKVPHENQERISL